MPQLKNSIIKKNSIIYNIIKKIWIRTIRPITLKRSNYSRFLIEKKILKEIKNKKVLIVGCAEYCKHYPRILRGNKIYSIDFDKNRKSYGANQHIVGDICEASKYYNKNYFDIILFFGIFGYGLNTNKNSEKALHECATIMKKNAKMLIFWSDSPGRNPVIPSKLKNYRLFKRISFAGISFGFRTKERGVFEFLQKK